MKRITIPLAALCGITLLLVTGASAQDKQPNQTTQSISRAVAPPEMGKASDATAAHPVGEVEELKRRVEELESQNRALALALADINAKLGAMARAETASAAPTPSATPAASAAARPSAPPRQDDKDPYVRWSEILGEGNRIKLYGFLRLDMDFDSQRPSNTQIPFFITSPDARASGTGNGDFSMHPRLTRFGIDYTGPSVSSLGDAKLTGKFEADFENGGTESRQIIRIRHAYLRLGWKDFSLLGGQTWDVVSPLYPTVNGDSLMWNAGNVGDRRPQLRAAYAPKLGRGKLSLAGAVGLTGAIDALDLDANGFRDGEESGLP